MSHFYFQVRPFILGSVLFLMFSTTGKSQEMELFVDAGISSSLFQTNHLENISSGLASFTLRGGIYLDVFQSEKLRLAFEAMLFNRKYNMEFPGDEFKYRFFSAQVPVLINYQATEWIHLEAGISGTLYDARLVTNNPDARIGSGFTHYDLGVLGGVQIALGERFLVGTRANIHFIPMLTFNEIGPRGELSRDKKDLYYRSVELFLRYRFNF